MDLVNHLEGRLLFAVPKKGRLQQAALDLLDGSDIQFRRDHRLDIALVKNHPIALVFLPAADIPTFVGEGRVDLGITGRDQIYEHEATTPPTEDTGAEEVLDLGFGYCQLQVQVPKHGPYQEPKDLIGRNISTSFAGLTKKYFETLEAQYGGTTNGDGPTSKQLRTKVKYLGGSVEAACALGVADGIVDLVAAQKYVTCTYNVPRKLLPTVTKITPGKRAPTITALDEPDWVAVNVMVEKVMIATVMDDLASCGAEDILMRTKIYRDVSTTNEHKRYLDPANADYPVQSVDIVWDERHQGIFMALNLDSLEPKHLPDQSKPLLAWMYQSTSPLQLRNCLSKAYNLIQLSSPFPFPTKRRSWPTDFWIINPLAPAPLSPKFNPSPATTPPPPYLHPLHPNAACLSQEEPDTTSFDPKYAQQSLSLLQTALQENAQNSIFARQLYIHAVIYLLQGLPPSSTLTEAEKTGLRSAVPGCFMLPESAHNSKFETGLVGKYEHDNAPSLTSRENPEQPKPSLLHRAFATTVLLLVLLVQFASPYLLWLFSTLRHYDREYNIQVRVCSLLVTFAKRVWDFVVSAVDPQYLIWFVAEVSAGVADGWGRGMRR
ncbi:MAG: hypothetical protein Q9205_004160 [Flavoplaca limonia]